MKFIDLNRGGVLTDTARCLKARYDAGVTNFKGDNSGVIEKVKVKDGTKDGYSECNIGGGGRLGIP